MSDFCPLARVSVSGNCARSRPIPMQACCSRRRIESALCWRHSQRRSTPERRVVIARELTKKFESISAHPAAALAALAAEERGEYVVIIDAAAEAAASVLDDAARGWLEALLEELPPARAAAVVSQRTGVAREAVYEAALELRRGVAPKRERGSR